MLVGKVSLKLASILITNFKCLLILVILESRTANDMMTTITIAYLAWLEATLNERSGQARIARRLVCQISLVTMKKAAVVFRNLHLRRTVGICVQQYRKLTNCICI